MFTSFIFSSLRHLRPRLSLVSERPRRISLPTDLAAEQGMSLMEVLVTITIVGLLSALPLANLNRQGMKLTDTLDELASNIRLARANAVSRSVHYLVTISSHSYSIQRLQDQDGDDVWEPNGAFTEQEFDLPSGITISDGAGTEMEFTTRGLLAPLPDGTPAGVVTIRMNGSEESQSGAIDVWPSGQVQRV
jgi:prepilin-type N-terminal cleavage/methylation domain-containing protein